MLFGWDAHEILDAVQQALSAQEKNKGTKCSRKKKALSAHEKKRH